MDWTQRIAELVAQHGAAARVVIVETSGPTPRGVGDAMLVTTAGREGRIGRSAIERPMIAEARRLIAQAEVDCARPRWLRSVIEFPTGEVLGEASGGTISVLVEAFSA